ncbi:RICIN domain-containing protein [Streptomyces acidiscabies]|uniref:RICIN domain-containing protein n=2 Tax=Streptomyces acidiscabies TaxID=42234 RepID=A0AAP6BGN9_9ACTN|nr:RICIN domain-containing protein [Streptomyces acidiscabies]MDX2964117.1 RICIN domain-containing protein [Streptomyces acidiscabies]MDX3021698.1 RICIN domain-containing protein [Streptomyces acidiscabies]MDX3795071.1 RICIN domain-containing protein [Streptomyces acidiscabies]GAV37773.1 ricin-type beta-trefoil lectin domain protein [Streptomyces acidiscabies]
MQSPNPPRPPYPPRPGRHPGDSDRDLVAQIGAAGDGSSRAVALLLARHWRATHEYAAICLAARGQSPQLVAAAAFHRVLGRLAAGRTGGALRPQFLVAVRDIVREWAGADAVPAALPELGKTVGGRGLRASRAGTPERRKLAEAAFRSLPAASQCLLWHAEVEAEPISIPAGLLGVDELTAGAGLREARTQFRTACVRAHRELAPSDRCRFYNRLLDVPLRRGGSLLPDVRDHLAECRYCRHAAEQLSFFDDALDILLAETVLGWGGRRYLESRAGRGGGGHGVAATPVHSGRHRSARIVDLAGRRAKAVLIGAGVTSLVLIGSVLVGSGWSGGGNGPGPQVTWGAPVGGPGFAAASGSAEPSASGAASPASVEQQPAEIAHGRLFAPSAGLCMDSEGGQVGDGARAVLADCSAAASQQWSYRADGLLRSASSPTLCLAADADGHQGAAVLAGCVVHSGEVFFDLTVRGELLLRRSGGLVVAPGESREGMGVVVTRRDGSAGQRWVFDSPAGTSGQVTPGPSGGTAPDTGRPQVGPEGKGSGGSQGSEGDSAAPGASSGGAGGSGASGGAGAQGGSEGGGGDEAPRYRTRVVQVGAPGTVDSGSGQGWGSAPASLPDSVSGVVERVTSTVREPVGKLAGQVSAVVGRASGVTGQVPVVARRASGDVGQAPVVAGQASKGVGQVADVLGGLTRGVAKG